MLGAEVIQQLAENAECLAQSLPSYKYILHESHTLYYQC